MAAGSTYTPIATTTLGSTASTITVSSIPSTYTDIVLVFQGGTTANTGLYVQFNGDTGTNYSNTKMYGYGSGYGSSRSISQVKGDIGGAWSTNADVIILNLQNYSNTSTYKTMLVRQSDANDTVTAGVVLWRSTSAINQIVFLNDSTTFAAGTNVTIYGITAA
jgi:hypothetical protein